MCGIVGYIGRREAAPLIVEGLKRLEYRGYDSFGVATKNKGITLAKHQGRISENAGSVSRLKGKIGIGHTRWATHGAPSDENAHPHADCSGKIALVHNGIIENYSGLRLQLLERGHTFRSETDTEVIVHLIEEEYAKKKDLLVAVQEVIPRIKGSFAILVIAEDEDLIIAARNASPLVIGIGDGENFIASDMTPMLEYTERAIFLEDGDIVSLTQDAVEILNNGQKVTRPVELIDWSVEDVKKGGFAHYMLKEIYEQPQAFYNTIRAINQGSLPRFARHPDSITVVACGSSFHAGLIFKYLVEGTCKIPTRLEYASEFRYYPPPVNGLVIGITQSGETADTLTALRQAKAHNCRTLAITNVLGSTVTRIADATLFMRAGPEISVAATKSFISQLAVLMQVISNLCGGKEEGILLQAHKSIEEVLLMDLTDSVQFCKEAQSIFYVGRGPFFAVSLEGALKMKEISYIHAEGYAAGELKHGPFALLSEKTPVIALCMPGETYGVMMSNIKEMKARGAPVIAIGCIGDTELSDIADHFIALPRTDLFIQVLTTLVVLQLLAYRTADALGRDIDKPRNLAKSVTVE
ncbi:MAG: glutamine--fructose-6-phosphate transaminase (isomerizing) [Methanoregula sp.]|uniref:glutamine--fructose-6-phosphate transaminase (isomerizing) n=1 Tax=Methanoregula sp. TaxID=2052170 RepID=UPI0025EAF3D0|nr:glutamine--fructose-6-phosphate transaminase (isomerizing) [Methanoregula sp.]MCK9631147.1 glutamine--fructose-6-phosphate transaminase (isomerizing) [Methanoregula sp.]